jgi:hypothetical protein
MFHHRLLIVLVCGMGLAAAAQDAVARPRLRRNRCVCHRGSATSAPNVDQMAAESRGHDSKPADEIRLEYRIVVPDHVKGTITVGTKSSDMERVVDHREEYRSWHRFGWEGYRNRFVYVLVLHQSLFAADLDLPFPQGTGHQLDAYDAGRDECAAAITSLTVRYGEEAVRESLKRQLEAERTKGNCE